MDYIYRTRWQITLLLVVASGLFVVTPRHAVAELLPPLATTRTPGFMFSERLPSPTPEIHASTIVETPQGLVIAWFGGKHEKNPDVGIWVSRRVDGKWLPATEVVDGSEGEEQEFACWNPVLFQPKDGPLMLFYKAGLDPRRWWGMLMTSTDGGVTWSKPRRLGTSDKLPEANQSLLGPVKNKPVQLEDGAILCPSSTENEGWRVHFELTRDLGKTWEVIGPINDASEFDIIQPSILTYADGAMQILCRSRQNVVVQSWSRDGGKTWGELSATPLPNPSSGTDAITLKDGRQLLVYNHTKRGRGGRRYLNVALSNDGKQWTPTMSLENEGEDAEYSYPAVIQTSDGRVHITYTWNRLEVKHVVLDPRQLQAASDFVGHRRGHTNTLLRLLSAAGALLL